VRKALPVRFAQSPALLPKAIAILPCFPDLKRSASLVLLCNRYSGFHSGSLAGFCKGTIYRASALGGVQMKTTILHELPDLLYR
jgi:hypothetical protein